MAQRKYDQKLIDEAIDMECLHYLVQGLVKIIRVMRGVKWHKESMIRN